MSRKKRYSVYIPTTPLSPILPIYPSPIDTKHALQSSRTSRASSPFITHNDHQVPNRLSSRDSSSSFYRVASSGVDQISIDSLPANTPNIKLLLIGDAGVGKTAVILGYCNELPSKGQLKIMNDAGTPIRDKRKNTENLNSSKSSKRKNNRTIQMKKRYSLNDYEELFNKKHNSNSLTNFTNLSNDEISEDGNEENLDELVVETRSTIGVDIKTSIVNIDNRFFKCILWDTAGQERYRNAMIPILYKDANGIILTYDICNMQSFENCCNHWLKEALENFDQSDLQNIRFYLIGNKIDLYTERKVTHENVIEAIEKIETNFKVTISGNFEITCKWPHVVERTVNMIIQDLVENACYEVMDYSAEQTPSLDGSAESNNSKNSDNESDENTLRYRHFNNNKTDRNKKNSNTVDISKPNNYFEVSSSDGSCCV
ncbi:hypothetical protein HG535_0F02170 [Zygotorulaspora mrakii]|uniref:GTP-binding protein YPT11 n=1 Tax=Zygotorulaspora mrakii TaxID=42260 RepID=A0A7H9B5Y4_ZYGMR|nr:uncharacterized protein HG535_0F02170 [Zygotorulaspora mrakii]QLG73706.1 hypothetical protein HG535_0F02170 [Zygotorulaspora mrakii]